MNLTNDQLARFWRRVDNGPETSCWQWSGTINHAGYGLFSVNNRNRLAHRVAYELTVGPIPDGLVIDHLCRNRACVNAAHLEPVTIAENVLRGIGGSAINARREACVHGHPFDAANTYIDKRRGHRACKACRRTREAGRRRRRARGQATA